MENEIMEAQERLLQERQKQGVSEMEKPSLAILKSLSEDTRKFMESKEKLISEEEGHKYREWCECDNCEKERQNLEIQKVKDQADNPEKLLKCWDVPLKYLGCSFDGFSGGDKVKDICKKTVNDRKSVLLTGSTGCGKTHLAVSMMRHFIQSSDVLLKGPSCMMDRGPDMMFVTVPDLLLQIRTCFDPKNDKTEEDLIERYSWLKFLVLDDLGAEKVSEWVEATLYLLIDRRNSWDKWTIVTSNLTLPEIEQHLGARIASRLSDMTVINMKLPDYRKKR